MVFQLKSFKFYSKTWTLDALLVKKRREQELVNEIRIEKNVTKSKHVKKK